MQAPERRPTILIADDQHDLRENLAEILREEGYHVLAAPDGQVALDMLRREHVDLVLADIAMPRVNGYQLLEYVVSTPEWSHLPFIFLTARSLDSDVRYGKELGADDYLVKPVDLADLLAAVRGKLRRARPAAGQRMTAQPDDIVLGRLRIAPAGHQAFLDGVPIGLSAREFRLLIYLARQPQVAVPVGDLLRATHDLDPSLTDASALLRPLVRSLRRKLGFAAGDDGAIETVRGVGYRLQPLE